MDSPRIDRSEISVVIADDHPAILDSVGRFLESEGFPVVATAQNGRRALTAIGTHHPRICVADVRMPQLDGVELARGVHDAGLATAVLLYSGISDHAIVPEALEAGASGVALKDAPLSDLVRAIEIVVRGSVYVDAALAAQVAQQSRSRGAHPLSPRECEVLRLLAEGGTYAEIGSSLFLSPDTIRTHAARAMTKLGARTRTQAVALALKSALIAS